ncbi:hypothetical protein BH11ACT2_BH11ACT2_23360 [soil metagenome]
MSKKIDDARKHLNKALKKHADIVGGSAVSLKKSQRAAAEVVQAALAYAELVTKKTGHPSPFDGLTDHDGLGASTIASLKKEREKLATKPITTIDAKAS